MLKTILVLTICLTLLIISGSIFYYLVIFIPDRNDDYTRNKAVEASIISECSHRTNDYISAKRYPNASEAKKDRDLYLEACLQNGGINN